MMATLGEVCIGIWRGLIEKSQNFENGFLRENFFLHVQLFEKYSVEHRSIQRKMILKIQMLKVLVCSSPLPHILQPTREVNPCGFIPQHGFHNSRYFRGMSAVLMFNNNVREIIHCPTLVPH